MKKEDKNEILKILSQMKRHIKESERKEKKITKKFEASIKRLGELM